jgi:hypothetical protein
MLLKMLPEQVSDRWDILADGIEANLPYVNDEDAEKMNNILSAILSDEIQCWISYRNKPDGTKNGVALVLTTTVDDLITRTRSLILYLVWAWEKTQASDWIEGFQAMQGFAKLMKCHRVIAYSNEEKVIKIAEKFNADMQTFMSFPVSI